MTLLSRPPESPDVADRAPRAPIPVVKLAGAAVIGAMLLFAVYSLMALDFSWSNMVASVDNAAKVFSQMEPISLPAPGDLLALTGMTLGIVILGTLLAALISIPVAYLSARNTTLSPGLRIIGRAIGVVTRAIPDVVLALAFALCFTLGSPLPGVLAIGIHSIGMISKLFADAIEQVDEGPPHAIRAVGGTRSQEFWSGIFPQVLPSWIATVLHRFDINLRGSAILGFAGVGGLGYAMKVAFADFPTGYGRGLGIALVIFVLCVVLEIVSSAIRRSMLGVEPSGRGIGDMVMRRIPRRAVRNPAPQRRAIPEATVDTMMRRPWTRERIRSTSWIVAAVVVVVAGYWMADIRYDQITWSYVIPTLQSFWPPSVGSYTLGDFLQALFVTVQVAFAATFLSFALSLVLGSLAARNVAPNSGIRSAARVTVVVFRGIPELVLAIFLIMVTGLGNQAGVIALAVGGIGLLGKLVADSFEEIPDGPRRALIATGASRGQSYASATLVRGMPPLIGNTLYLLDTNIRAATILGIVGGSGIGFYLTNASTVLSLHGQVTTLVLMLVVTVLAIELLAAWLRRVFR